MEAGVCRDKDGHYQLPLPLRNPGKPPPNNRVVALHHLQGLRKRLVRDSQHYQLCREFMDNLFKENYAEEVPTTELEPSISASYLPHHGVYSLSKPGKIRVLMDGSAKFYGISLNDQLLTGQISQTHCKIYTVYQSKKMWLLLVIFVVCFSNFESSQIIATTCGSCGSRMEISMQR